MKQIYIHTDPNVIPITSADIRKGIIVKDTQEGTLVGFVAFYGAGPQVQIKTIEACNKDVYISLLELIKAYFPVYKFYQL